MERCNSFVPKFIVCIQTVTCSLSIPLHCVTYCTYFQSMLLTDMQHFLQQQKNSSDSEIELLEGMGVDTHPSRPPPPMPLLPLMPLMPSTSLEGPEEIMGTSSSSRGYGNEGNIGGGPSRGNRNGGQQQVEELGSYAGSGLQGGLGRPIVLGNGEGDLVSPTYFNEDGAESDDRLSAEEHRLLRLDSATCVSITSTFIILISSYV